MAGDSLDDALRVCRKLREQGISATLDYLGENVTSLEEAVRSRDMYVRTVRALADAGLEPNVSLKLTQFGIDFSTEACESNVETVVREAEAVKGFVRIDMESSAYTERTLALVRRVHARHPHCGTVLQAYLRRTEQDAFTLSSEAIRVRLCKGAYLEPPDVAFEKKPEVDRNYVRLAGILLEAGHYPAIATHDERIVEIVRRFPKDRFEFQMLYGIRRDLQKHLVDDGYRLRLYVPFGEAWYPYFMRRLAERPANVFFLLKNLL